MAEDEKEKVHPGAEARKKRMTEGKESMIEALEESNGIATPACKAVGISRDTHYRWMKECPEYKRKVEEAKEASIDCVEGHLFKQIKGGNTTATIFFLKTRAKHRGYTEDININHGGSVATTMQIVTKADLDEEKLKEEIDFVET